MRQGCCRIRNLRTMLTEQCQVEQTKTITVFVDLSQPFPPNFARPPQNPSAGDKASMCKITWEKHRCGHKTMVGTPDYCKYATMGPTGRKSMCTQHRSTVVSDQGQGLCNKASCILSSKNGVWICCTCGFGYQGSDRNRYAHCANTRCNHEVCGECKEFNVENVAEMEAEDEVSPSSSDHTNWSVSSYPSGLGQHSGGEEEE